MIVLVSFFLPWIALFALKYRVGYIHAIFLFLTFQCVAVYNVGQDFGVNRPFFIFLSGNFAVLAGLWLGKIFFGKNSPVLPYRKLERKEKKKVSFFIFFVFSMVVYHYLVGGVPLLSENVVLDRFDNDSSGLFGLPGRVNLFGTFFCFVLAGMSYFYSRGEIARRQFYFATLILFFSLVLAGNKGNVVQFVVAIMLVLPYAYKNRKYLGVRKKIKIRHIALSGILAIAFFFVVSAVHMKAGDTTYSGVFEALERRVIEVSGKAFYVTATSVLDLEGIGYGSYFLNDISFFLGSILGDGFSQHSTINLVSSYVTGRDLDSGLFLVPVTITVHGYSLLEFGVWGPAFIGVILGVFMSWLYFFPYKSVNVTNSAMILYIQVMVFWVVTKGSVGYYVPNMLIMLLFFYIILCLYNIFSRARY